MSGTNGNSQDPPEQRPNNGNGNLVPFPKGQSGNPAGRPKGAKDGLRATLRKRLKSAPEGMMIDMLKVLGVDPKDKQNADVIIDVLLYKVAQGDMQALKLAFDQTEEPLKLSLDLGGELHHEHKLDLAKCSPEELNILESLGLPSGPDI